MLEPSPEPATSSAAHNEPKPSIAAHLEFNPSAESKEPSAESFTLKTCLESESAKQAEVGVV
jgi:hypothetical protein